MSTNLQTLVRKSIVVAAPRDLAFEVFTARIGTWWPLESHHIGRATPSDAIIEPRVGGRWYERTEDGSECEWGRVLAYDPPSRLVLSWDISAQWQHEDGLGTEVEVRFIAQGAETTRVELEHRHLDRFGEARDKMRETFESPMGWGGILESFARATAGAREGKAS